MSSPTAYNVTLAIMSIFLVATCSGAGYLYKKNKDNNETILELEKQLSENNLYIENNKLKDQLKSQKEKYEKEIEIITRKWAVGEWRLNKIREQMKKVKNSYT